MDPKTPAPSLTPETNTSTKDMNKPTGEVESENSFSSLLEFAANNDVEGFQKSIELNGSAIDRVGLWYVHRKADVNRSCGPDKSTALHCAVSGGTVNAVDVAKLLLLAGADPNSTDAQGHRPFDVIDVSPKLPDLKATLEELLKNDDFVYQQDFQISTVSLKSSSPSLSSSPDNCSLSGVSESMSPPLASRLSDIHVSSMPEKKEYPVDPSLPDIKNSIYATDEFRMYSFKIRPCSRAYSHDWTECPFVHPGENARRRDPRKFHYSCVPCPEFRKGACRRGTCVNMLMEFLSAGFIQHRSGVASPRSAANAMDMASALSLFPGSPSAVSAMSPSPFTPPMSPAGVAISHSSMAWPQQSIPTLHLPGSTLQTSRLRSSLSARDMLVEEFNVLQDFDVQQQQLLNDLSHFTQPNLSSASGNLSVRSKALTPSNLDELFSAEMSSPRYADHVAASTMFSPSHKSVVLNQFQHQQGMLSPIKTNDVTSRHEPLSPLSSRFSSLSHREKQQQHLRSLSSRDLGSNGAGIVNSPANSWSKWESPNGKIDWSVQGEELAWHRKTFSIEQNREGPDLSWVQSLVKESPPGIQETPTLPVSGMTVSADGSNSISRIDSIDHAVLGAWLEQMQLDQIVA
ncbi:Zinc finger CCCH domain-containing protein 30 [Vitis vinifera]|uniref:Zinc finger CCCH domain-containing protein 30 n=1 Tax=Vitis vinifera TaxID=29760 RepID=A0A438DBJ4_VITVI|nr:Zinc finger CCCH domain-containing protein 30 [Vitis vinifera]